jgi:hypothetical protein
MRGLRTRAIEVETVDGALIGLDSFHQVFPGVKAVHHPTAIVNAGVTLEDILQAIQQGNHGINALTKESRAHFAKSQAKDDQIISALDRQAQLVQRVLDRIHTLNHQNSQLRDQLMALLLSLNEKVNSVQAQHAFTLEWLGQIDEAIVTGFLVHSATLKEELESLYPTPSSGQPLDLIKVNILKLVVTTIGMLYLENEQRAHLMAMLEPFSAETTAAGLGLKLRQFLGQLPR